MLRSIMSSCLECLTSISCIDRDRYEEEEAEGTDSTVYSTAVALAVMGCFQVSRMTSAFPIPSGKPSDMDIPAVMARSAVDNPVAICLG